MSYSKIKRKLNNLKNSDYALQSRRFFKTGPGEYAEHDQFLGIKVPVLRKIAQYQKQIELFDIKKLLCSPFHEERFLALVFLIKQYKHSNKAGKKKYYDFYLYYKRYINNWDLVDISAHHVLGHYLFQNKQTVILKKLALSKYLWDRRIAIIATYYFIKNKEYQPTLLLSSLLINDNQDLIHKAVGWMLREIGKRDLKREFCFLDQYAHKMPRVMLRYAIEHLPEKERKYYLEKKS